MKILNVKLTKGRKEHRASIAVCSEHPVEEFLSLLKAGMCIQDSVILGFKDSQGVLLLPSLICNNPELIRTDDYELILKEKPLPTRPEEQFSHVISEIRINNQLNDEEYFILRTWMRENNQMIGQVYHTFLVKHNVDGFIEWLLKSSGIRQPHNTQSIHSIHNIHNIHNLHNTHNTHNSHNTLLESSETPRDREITRNRDERPSTTRAGDRPRTSNQDRKSYQKYLQIMWELEAQGFLEQTNVRLIKAMILGENFDVMREFDYYFLNNISLQELGTKLQKLADKLSLYMERPSSPMPKNNQMQFLVESFARECLVSAEDIEILKKLISEENEFVFSAYDVYESDKDQTELVDSLLRAINKKKKEEESLRSDSFYPEAPQANEEI